MMFLSQITTKKKNILAVTLAVLAVIGVVLFLLREQLSAPAAQTTLNQEDLANLVKPSVVRIIQRATGQVTMPVIDMDLATLSIFIVPDQKPAVKPIDKYLSGSGFVVNPDGYILTNAHVASTETIKLIYVEDFVKGLLEEKAKNLKGAEMEALLSNQQPLLDFAQRSLEFVEKNSSFDLKSSLTVLNPASSREDLNGLIQNSFPAEIIDINNNFAKDEKDVALIKIQAKNLPSISLGDDNNIATGNGIFVFGFPSTAELNQKNPLESTFTKGIVSAIKFSQSKDFKVFQTDAKISQGSSGGPLFNEQGEVVGIITFQTGKLARTEGDNFAFALPIRLAKTLLEKNNVIASAGNYELHFKTGLDLFYANRYEQALKEFELTKKTNSNFAAEKYLSSYIRQSGELLARGESLDSNWRGLLAWLKSLGGFGWFVIGGRLVLIALVMLALWFARKRLLRDEQELDLLSSELEEEKRNKDSLLKQLTDKGTELPLPDTEIHQASRLALEIPHPHVTTFFKEARQIGLKDNQIIDELAKAGWNEEEIRKSANHKDSQ